MSEEIFAPFLLTESIKEDLHFIILQLEFATCTRGNDDNTTDEELENIHRAAKKEIHRIIKNEILKKLNALTSLEKKI